MKTVIFHLGIHKTATTHLQHFLGEHESELLEQNVRFVPLYEVRERFTRKRRKPQEFVTELRSLLDELPEDGSVVISDENFSGSAVELPQNRLYRGSKFLSRSIAQLSDVRVVVVVCLKNPVRFVPSLYCEYLRNRSFLSFQEFLGEEGASLSFRPRFRWLARLPAHSEVSVIPFEKDEGGGIPAVLGAILKAARVAAGPTHALVEQYTSAKKSGSASVSRSVLTQEAVEALSEIGGDEARLALREWEKTGKVPGTTPFRPFDSVTEDKLTTIYRQDLKWAAWIAKGKHQKPSRSLLARLARAVRRLGGKK